MTVDNSIKQVVVMRTDLNMRKGKMVAQGAHASGMFMTQKLMNCQIPMANELLWMRDGMTKICVGVGSEAELLAIFDAATKAGLTVNLVTDAGLTEFSGVATKTCLAIGPNLSEAVDKITGGLKLL